MTEFLFSCPEVWENIIFSNVYGTIDESSKTIAVTVPFGTNVTKLIAFFTTTGSSVDVGNTAQFSGTTANDFTSPVTYTVFAGDGTHTNYVVTVTTASFQSPTHVQAIAGNGRVLVGWTPSAGASSYGVYYSTSSSISTANYENMITTSNASIDVSSLTNNTTYYFIVTAISGNAVTSASSPSASAMPSATAAFNTWIWVSGDDLPNDPGTYGTLGIPAAANCPGSRNSGVSWRDGNNNLWLFGGYGRDSTGAEGVLNDLWKFDGTDWTWVSGATGMWQSGGVVDGYGAYGTKGTVGMHNTPGARRSAVSWIDGSGNLWLFGGHGYDCGEVFGGYGSQNSLNDLWKFDGTNWTWVGGSNIGGQIGTYGTKGVPAPGNVPGARDSAVSWVDRGGNLWLFGGYYEFYGNYSQPIVGFLNDLWKFDGTNWTWVSGTNAENQAGNYGTRGTPAAANVPDARWGATSWTDASDNLWLFGGTGYSAAGGSTLLNDLWKFDGANWTWVSGSNLENQNGIYGAKRVAASANVPGGRTSAVSWMDPNGNFWIFGGTGYPAAGSALILDDLWKFDGTDWTWMSGTNSGGLGNYTTKGTASTANVPSGRSGAVSWTDTSGNLWLFGGETLTSSNDNLYSNNLMEFEP